MPETFQLKNIFNISLVETIGRDLQEVWPYFNKEEFEESIGPLLTPLSFSERAHLIAEKLHYFLPSSFPEAVNIMLRSFGPELDFRDDWGYDVLYYLPHANFVAKYGLEHYEVSMNALYEITKRFSSEFPIRTFIIHYPERTMKILHEWVTDDNAHVRRLVSEGTRPRLPWAPRLPGFQKDPRPVINLLEKLKEDPIIFVRRSVANNLNDIAKDHPDLVVEVLERWKQADSQNIRWITKHALRSLLKEGHEGALRLLGYKPGVHVEVDQFSMQQTVGMGENADFSFTLVSHESSPVDVMVDFVVSFMKANGKQKPKVFKLSRHMLSAEVKITMRKTLSFKPISTRKYYPGKHTLGIKVNGVVVFERDFEVIVN